MSNWTAALLAVRGASIVALSAFVCVGLIVVLHPFLQRYALAKPNARSSHVKPTPQGGGIAVIAATILATGFGHFSLGAPATPLIAAFAAASVMACIGVADDIHPLGVVPRLVLQAAAVVALLYSLPDELRVLPLLPWWLEKILLFFGGLWFVNLVNFMDGIDWMTVVEIVPIMAGLVALGCLGAFAPSGIAVALALGGAMLGFAYFNRPTARLFLGDVGSLPIGLITGWLLVLLAGEGHLAAALLLPLYYLADATLTLIRRLARGEKVWQAHRTHYYQRATDRGFTVTQIVARVFVVNLALAALAVVSVVVPGVVSALAALCAGTALVGWTLARFARGAWRRGSST
jgi:UDP-N-acetylmuramyl pentapeptide phosphotransferase/UDP-N-acetylglucosamine-1-phosphate transferase